MLPEPEFDRVEAYVRGDLSAAERAAFERALAADGDLRAEVEAVRFLVDGLSAVALRERIAAAGQRYAGAAEDEADGGEASHPAATNHGERSAAGGRVVRLRRWGAIATAAAAIFLAGLWFTGAFGNGARAGDGDFFEPAIGLPTTLGLAEDVEFQEGMVDYKLGDYEAALARWAPLLSAEPGNDTLLFYGGVALLALHRDAEGEAQLRAIDEDYLAGRDYYLAIAGLRAGDQAGAERLLRAVAESESVYAERARGVLEEVRER